MIVDGTTKGAVDRTELHASMRGQCFVRYPMQLWKANGTLPAYERVGSVAFVFAAQVWGSRSGDLHLAHTPTFRPAAAEVARSAIADHISQGPPPGLPPEPSRGASQGKPTTAAGSAALRAKSGSNQKLRVHQYTPFSVLFRPHTLPFMRQAWKIPSQETKESVDIRTNNVSADKNLNEWISHLVKRKGQTYYDTGYKWYERSQYRPNHRTYSGVHDAHEADR